MMNAGRAGGGFLDLHASASAGDVAKVKRWVIERSTPVDSRKEGYTPLHKAAIAGKVEAIRELLNLGADIQAKSFANYTPLHFAAQHGHVDAVRVLLQNGAEALAVLDNGKSAEDLAREKGFSDVIETIRSETLTSIKVRYSTRVSRRMSAMNSGGGARDPRHPSYMKEKLAAANSPDSLAAPTFDPTAAANRKSRRAAFQMSEEDRAAALQSEPVLASTPNRRSVQRLSSSSPDNSLAPAAPPAVDICSPRTAETMSPRIDEPPSKAAPPPPAIVVTSEERPPPTRPSPAPPVAPQPAPASSSNTSDSHIEAEPPKQKKKLFKKLPCTIL